MIQTANYVARKFGVKSGLPGFIGRKLCPDLIFVRPDLERYKLVTEQIKNLLKDYDSGVEVPSPDEFILDVTEFLKAAGLDHDLGKIYIGDKIRRLIFDNI
jgi:nucleotidyltransferase/DNA polymerase involved in DNA repair